MIDGRYFFPRSAKYVEARAALVGEALRITAMDGAVLAEVPFKTVKISARLANIARRFTLPDGASFETYDNDGVDFLMQDARRLPGQGWVDRLERSWRVVLASVLIAAAAGAAFVIWGIPATALMLARATPPSIAIAMSDQTMRILDGQTLHPSKLSPAEQKKVVALFDRVAAVAPRGAHGYALLIRDSKTVGVNAFALPDGRIVVTDQLWRFVRNDEEIEGVFAHEMSHVDHAHGLQRVYEASLVPAAIAVITGDVSQVGQLSVILPGILLQSAYSRENEQQADDDAARLLKRIGAKPSSLAAFLERLDQQHCGKEGCKGSWIGDHPEARFRIERLHAEDAKK